LDYLAINGTALKPSRIGLGTWAIGGRMWGGTDEQESVRTIHAAIDRGITLIDTAPAYGFGRSEEILGAALKGGFRDKVIVATKCGIEWANNRAYRNGTRERILREIDDSRARLGVECIDLYQVHWPDPLVPIEETADAMRQLWEQGRIRAIGVCNFTVDQMKQFERAAPIHTSQPPLNLFEQVSAKAVLGYCAQRGIVVSSYGALCRGLLSGRMRPDTVFLGDDLRKIDPKFQAERYPQYLAAVESLDRFAQERFNRRIIHLALRWILDQPGAGVALCGARRPEQTAAVEGVFGWSLSKTDLEEIDEILKHTIADPIGPDFISTRVRSVESMPAAS
jgi:aryl-alcohol dehydrogenase-like predicted oxidoreductase